MNTSDILERKRKTKKPCPDCFLNQNLCMCDLIPRMSLRTRVCLIVHAKELKRTTNTGRLAVKSLVNSEMRIRGLDHDTLDLSDLLSPTYRTLLFYPADSARDLTRDFVEQDHRPIQLLVPDGNWRQASKVHYRHKELKDIPRVMIKSPNIDKFHLRSESTPEGMATLQAIAHALGVIESEEVKKDLLNVYNVKLERTLKGRGKNIVI